MARKMFKTVGGYLRSNADNLYYAQPKAEPEGRTPISDDDGSRQIINSLLRQRGYELIGDQETPRDGVKRLLSLAEGDQHIKTLNDVLKWLGKGRVEVTFL